MPWEWHGWEDCRLVLLRHTPKTGAATRMHATPRRNGRVRLLERRSDPVSYGPLPAGMLKFAERAARYDEPVLITGETGSGKTYLAKLIHDLSPRSSQPAVRVNCAGAPRRYSRPTPRARHTWVPERTPVSDCASHRAPAVKPPNPVHTVMRPVPCSAPYRRVRQVIKVAIWVVVPGAGVTGGCSDQVSPRSQRHEVETLAAPNEIAL
jgi:energy-coupling factor transporter ATP-binding protein EcfA2